MEYKHFRSLFNTRKNSIQPRLTTESFRVHPEDDSVYIEPTIEKIMFENEKPSIILVSAVGATGKTTLARKLSGQTNLPVLDLGIHKPVGDNSLTGLITESFPIAEVSSVLQGLNDGTFGIIIDGIDEGRTKTTEKAFEAFLDDLVSLCCNSKCPVFVILGRTVILDDCWMYLTDAQVETALVTIEPFSVESAERYIDAFARDAHSHHISEYRDARDKIITKMSAAFATNDASGNPEFLAFMGYPPVLDAIVTLLKEEKNYYKLTQAVEGTGGNDVETSLLLEITKYILNREREEKIIPNVVAPLVEGMPASIQEIALKEAFGILEQCERLVAFCLCKEISISTFNDRHLDEQYNERLSTWMREHTLLSNHGFRNAVFEAFSLSVLMNSSQKSHLDLVAEYLASQKSSYHLIYMLDAVSPNNQIDRNFIKYIVDASLEFRSVRATVDIAVDGPSWEDVDDDDAEQRLEINVELLLGGQNEMNESKIFAFQSTCAIDTILTLGPRLAGAFITVPCELVIRGNQEVEIIAPMVVSARKLKFEAPQLVLRSPKNVRSDIGMVGDCKVLASSLRSITTGGYPLRIHAEDYSNVGFPIVQYTQNRTPRPTDPLLGQKHLRLKRILLEFRSHSRGALARYRGKIDSQRVLKNDTGRYVLECLVRDGIINTRGDFYFIDADRLHEYLGVSWHELRSGQIPKKMNNYLNKL